MTRKLLLVALAITVFFSGCVIRAIHPFYTKDTLVFKSELSGVWFDTDLEDEKQGKEGSWTFKPIEGTYYELQLIQDEKPWTFDAHLFEVSGQLFMNMYPNIEKTEEFYEGFYHLQLLPTHNVAKVILEKNSLKLQFIDGEIFEDLLENEKLRIKHEKREDGIVLTASSKELQGFLAKYMNEEELFDIEVLLSLVRKL